MVMKCKKNYYDILGVTPESDKNEVKASYRKLARKFHPDVNRDFGSEEMFKAVLEAYETLSDDKKRIEYNTKNGFYKKSKQDFTQKEANSKETQKPKAKSHYEEDYDEEFEDDFEDFEYNQNTKTDNKQQFKKNYKTNYSNWFFKDRVNSILDEISKNHAKKNNNKETFKHELKNGDDITTTISITLSEAISGTERILNIMHKELCPHCQGRKFINGSKCTKCNGTGIFELKKKITVKIPAGVKNNNKLRLIGEGNPGFHGGKDGNLYINIIVEDDKNIKIEGNNIIYNLAVSPFEAVLGEEIEIPVFGGFVNFTLPPITSSGQQFRIAKKGLKTNGNVGDMIINVQIKLPEKLSDDELNLYAKLKKMSKTSVRETD